jgi:hypothetical protein
MTKNITMRATTEEQKLIRLIRALDLDPTTVITKILDLGFISTPPKPILETPQTPAPPEEPPKKKTPKPRNTKKTPKK